MIRINSDEYFNAFVTEVTIPVVPWDLGLDDPDYDDVLFKGIGELESFESGRAVTNGMDLFGNKTFIITGINSDYNNPAGEDLIIIDEQNYPPFQPYNSGLFDGLIAKIEKGGIRYVLFKESSGDIIKAYFPVIYPNPANDYIHFEFEIPANSELVLEIVDIFGKSMYKYKEPSSGGLADISVPLDKFPAGLYFLNSKVNNMIYNTKFVKY